MKRGDKISALSFSALGPRSFLFSLTAGRLVPRTVERREVLRRVDQNSSENVDTNSRENVDTNSRENVDTNSTDNVETNSTDNVEDDTNEESENDL